MKYTKYKLFSAIGLYISFLLIGHHGPVSAYADEFRPLVVTAPPTGATHDEASSAKSVLFFNPVTQVYEAEPTHLKAEEATRLWSCIAQRRVNDIRSFEECYASFYPKAVVLDHGHTHSHKKHAPLKMFKKDDELHDHDVKIRKFKPRTA